MGNLNKAQPQQSPKKKANRSTFACPLCDERNLSRQGLLDHCSRAHAGAARAAVCPICASMPWGDPNYRSNNFVSHLQMRHKCDYDVLADYENDEDDTLRRVLEMSMQSHGRADEDVLLEQALLASASSGF